VIEVRTLGPAKIVTGQPAQYEILVQNSGTIPAEDLTVTIRIPSAVELGRIQPSHGKVELPMITPARTAGAAGSRELQWRLGTLPASQQERLILRIIPREVRAVDLAVRCDYQPPTSQTRIEVQEPQLEIIWEGPSRFLAQTAQTARIELVNRGTAEARQVEVLFRLDGPGELSPPVWRVDSLPPGKRTSANIQLTVPDARVVTLQVQARCLGGFQAQFAQKLTVQQPKLELKLDVPESLYVGTDGRGYLRVDNAGDAAAESLQVTVAIPAEIEWLEDASRADIRVENRRIVWNPGSLGPGGTLELPFRFRATEAGPLLWRVEAKSGKWVAAASGQTLAEGVAHLKLRLVDPHLPVPVGNDATYEIHIENCGTKSVEKAEAVVFFSEGIEPIGAHGAVARIAPGQVVFEPIGPLPPGKQHVLRVIARAQKPGHHTCRAEVYYGGRSIRLMDQQVSLFYTTRKEADLARQSERAPSANSREPSGSTPPVAEIATRPESPTPVGNNPRSSLD